MGPPIKTFCQETETSFEVEGNQALLEFRSGPSTFPYIYNGFRASVQFLIKTNEKSVTNYGSPSGSTLPKKILRGPESHTRMPPNSAYPDMMIPTHPFHRHDDTMEEPMGNERSSYGKSLLSFTLKTDFNMILFGSYSS